MSKTLWQYACDLGARMVDGAFDGIVSVGDWEAVREQRQQEFLKSIGLHPLPGRSDLQITECGEFVGDGYRARKLAYQILPGCWATANLYLPAAQSDEACPGILYCCGHNRMGVQGYQAHAAMWARRGYACFIFDTIEQHDNPGEHHGLCVFDRYDWLSLGYSAAGGELWNSIRALDVFCSMPEVDASRIGATGISGGGASSFYLTIADARVKAVATSCGLSLAPHALETLTTLGHCDCMYLHNWWQRDMSEFAGLIAPRPLLYCFASEDGLFTPPEYTALHARTRRLYELYDCADDCQLYEYPGPHAYSDDSIQRINAWFDEHVAGRPMPEEACKENKHSEKVVTVFDGAMPVPNHLDLLPELVSPVGSYRLPRDETDWPDVRAEVVAELRSEVFHWAYDSGETLEMEQVGNWRRKDGIVCCRYRGRIAGMDVWVQTLVPEKGSDRVIVGIANEDETLLHVTGSITAITDCSTRIVICPRGTGFTAMHPALGGRIQRAAALVGLTPALLMIHDTRLILDWLRALPDVAHKPITLFGRETAAVAAAYTAILDESIAGVVLQDLPASHRSGGWLPRILRVTDLVPALGLLAPRPLALVGECPLPSMTWPPRTYVRLGCEDKALRALGLSNEVLS
jgi:dienelactone hydrolase